MVYLLGEQIVEGDLEEVLLKRLPSFFLVSSKEAGEILERTGFTYEEDITASKTTFCKVESQQDCMYGTFAIPRLLDVLGIRYQVLFFINETYVVIVSDDGFAERIIQRIRKGKIHQAETKEQFLYNFITEFMRRDMVVLEQYERLLMELEEQVLNGKVQDFQNKIVPLRKKLLILRSYYDQIADMGREFEENENGFFQKKRLKYFGTLTDRADRLMDKTIFLLEYAGQVRDAYEAGCQAKQNNNMQFLTIVSTIFFPLTLITGWYGMNFENMPELAHGYPAVICASIAIVLICIFIFKKKKII